MRTIEDDIAEINAGNEASLNAIAVGIDDLKAENAKLRQALLPFVTAYNKAADPIGDSDLYNEQPRSVSVTLGDCRLAARIIRETE